MTTQPPKGRSGGSAFLQVVSITGTLGVGNTLTAAGVPTGASVQWTRNGAPISGATGLTYVQQDADVGASLSLAVNPQGGGGGGPPASNLDFGQAGNPFETVI